MHSITFDAAAAVLLLSSLISLGLLLKRTPKSRLVSSTSVLSISDISNSIFTATMIFLHQFYTNNGLSSNQKVSTTKDQYESLLRNSMKAYKNSTNLIEEGIDNEEECDFKSVFFQFALFFIPFANAFTSLLSFSTDCYVNATLANRQCCKLTESYDQVKKADLDEAENIENVESGNFASKEDERQNKRNLKKTRKYTALSITSQWIIPALFTGMFQLANYKSIEATNESNENLVCSIIANFPFEDYASELNVTNDVLSADFLGSSSSHNYVNSEDDLLWPNPNSSEVNDIVSRVQGIVKNFLNASKTENESANDPSYYNLTQLLGIVNRKEIESNEFVIKNQNLNDKNDARVVGNNKFIKNINSSKDRSTLESKSSYFNYHSFDRNELREITDNFQVFRYAKNRCLVSTKFLRINLFIFFVLVYFLPIFVSTVLLIISHYKCREIARKLKENDAKIVLMKRQVQLLNNENADSNESRTSSCGWFLPDEEAEESKQIQRSGPQEQSQNQHGERCTRLEETACQLACETEKMQNFFEIFKVNVLAAVALWTPFFLQVLSKVFFCSNAPKWLMEMSFLATIAFAVFRNAVDLNIMKIENDAETSKKDNSVRPK